MIKIFMRNEKWRIKIGDEVWEFKDLKELEKILKKLIKFKEDYGKLS